MNNSVLIAKNTRLTFKIIAKAIYVSSNGEIILSIQQYGPQQKIPELSVEYLESLCSNFYYGGYSHPNAIADIMLLNGYLKTRNYGDFYSSLRSNLEEQRITIISTELSL